jgi:hypothetical protein
MVAVAVGRVNNNARPRLRLWLRVIFGDPMATSKQQIVHAHSFRHETPEYPHPEIVCRAAGFPSRRWACASFCMEVGQLPAFWRCEKAGDSWVMVLHSVVCGCCSVRRLAGAGHNSGKAHENGSQLTRKMGGRIK